MVRAEFTNIPVLNVLPDIPQIYNNSQGFSFILDAIILATLFAALFAPLGRMIFKSKETKTMGQRFGAVLGIIFGVSGAFALADAGLTLFGFWVTALLAALFFSFALYKIMLNIFGKKASVLAGVIAFIIAWVLMDAYLVTTDLEIVRNVFGFLSLLAPMIFIVAVLYLISKRKKTGTTETEKETPGAGGPGVFQRMFNWLKPKPKTAAQLGNEVKTASVQATEAANAIKEALEAATGTQTARDAGEIVGTARKHVKLALDAANRAENTLEKIPAEKQTEFAPAATQARLSANETQLVLSEIETIASKRYLKVAQDAWQKNQHMSELAIRGATRANTPGAPINAVKVDAEQSRRDADAAKEESDTIKQVYGVMKGRLPLTVGLGVTPRNKADLATVKHYLDESAARTKEADEAVKNVEKNLKAMQKEEAPEKIKEHWWQFTRPKAGDLRILEEVEEGEKKAKDAAKDAKTGEKDIYVIIKDQESINKDLTGADNDAARTMQEGDALKSKPLTKQQILAFYSRVNERLENIDKMFVIIRNRTKDNAQKLEKNDYKKRVDELTNKVAAINGEFTRAREILEKEFRPAARTPEAQTVLAKVDNVIIDFNTHLATLNATIARLNQGHVDQYERMRTECLVALQKIQKREELTNKYTGIARIAITRLGEQAEKGETKSPALYSAINNISSTYQRLHEEIRTIYEPSHKFISDYLKSYNKVIDSIRQDLEECAQYLKNIKLPSKMLQEGMETLAKIIKQPQIIPPETGREYRR